MPGRGVANVGSFGYLSGNPTSKRPEALPDIAQPKSGRQGQLRIPADVRQHFKKQLLNEVNRLIIMGILSFLFGHKSNGQNNLIDITSKSEEGFQDLVLSIVNKKLNSNTWTLIAKGQYKGTIVGIRIKLVDGLKPGIVNGEMDKTAFAVDAFEISSIGQESDNFIKILSELYGYKTSKKFTSKPLIFTGFSLNSNQAFLDKGHFKFKLFFDDKNEHGLYSEIYLNPNLPEGIIEIPEKDPEYRENLVKAMIE